jgi:SAM-dependent methyltransferase
MTFASETRFRKNQVSASITIRQFNMNHTDHVNLLRGCVPTLGSATPGSAPVPASVWADFGSGTGAFTLALAELIGPGSAIHSIDRDASALRIQADEMRRRFPDVALHTYAHDYTRPLTLPPLDGIVAANTLHFHRDADKLRIVQMLKSHLKKGGRMIVVEYNVDASAGNFAVPYPLPFVRWERLANQAGFSRTELLVTRPSRFLSQIYSACSD